MQPRLPEGLPHPLAGAAAVSAGTVVTTDVDARLTAERSLIERICPRLALEVSRHGLTAPEIDPARATYTLKPDSFSGDAALMGQWPADSAGRKGNLVIHGDGSFFAEFDVLANDPAKARQFVEATTVWGRGERIGAELRMLEWPE